MSERDLRPLLGRTMVLVAHPDDECISCGALLQRMREPVAVFATNGAPQDPYFWQQHGSREAYAKLRQEEARRALAHVGVSELTFLAERDAVLVDQELFRNLDAAYELLAEIARHKRPEAILTLAYEGGHPDHDSCSFLAAQVGHATGVPVWEAPLYRRKREELSVQEFLEPDGSEVLLYPTEEELARKLAMCREYSSQGDFLKIFGVEREIFRPQKKYDYSRPPHEGELNYERWQWTMTGREVSEGFERFRRPVAKPGNKQPAV